MKRESTSKRLKCANMALVRICLNVEAYRLGHGVINDENVDRLLTDILALADAHVYPEMVFEIEDERAAQANAA